MRTRGASVPCVKTVKRPSRCRSLRVSEVYAHTRDQKQSGNLDSKGLGSSYKFNIRTLRIGKYRIRTQQICEG
eukprot:6198934-Pleurochrysis_carterae.AAC.5